MAEDLWFKAFHERKNRGIKLYDIIAHCRWRKLAARTVEGLIDGFLLKTDGWNEGIGDECDVTSGLTQQGLRPIIMDISLGILQQSKDPSLRINAELSNVPLSDCTVECILDISTSDHCPFDDLDIILREYARILKPEGRLLLIHNSTYSLTWSILRRCGRISPAYSGFPPAYYFSPARVISVLQRHGFRIGCRYYTNIFGWARGLINRLPQCFHSIVLKIAGLELIVPSFLLSCFARQHVIIAELLR